MVKKKNNPYEDFIAPSVSASSAYSGSRVQSAVAQDNPYGVKPQTPTPIVDSNNPYGGYQRVSGVIATGATGPEGGTEPKMDGSEGGNPYGGKITSDADYYKSVYDKWDEYYRNEEAKAKATLEQNKETIDNAYNAAVAESQAAYKRAMSTYGSTGESLAKMGLTGSGLSDYMNGQAYATQRAEAVAAGQERNAALREADNAYASALNAANDTVFAEKYNLLQQQFADYKNEKTTKSGLFDQIMQYAYGGEVSAQMLRTLANESGVEFDPESWAVIDAAAATASEQKMTDKEAAFAQALLTSESLANLSAEEAAAQISALAEAYGIDKSRPFWARLQKTLGFTDPSMSEDSTDEGTTTKGEASASVNYTPEILQATQARAAFDSDKTITEATERIKAAINKLADADITPHSGDGYNFTTNDTDKVYATKGWNYNDGTDFSLYVDGKEYKLEWNLPVQDQSVANTLTQIAGGNPKIGQAVVSCGDLFIFGDDGKWHTASSRYLSNSDVYKSAVDACKDFFNNGSSGVTEEHTTITPGVSVEESSSSGDTEKLWDDVINGALDSFTIKDGEIISADGKTVIKLGSFGQKLVEILQNVELTDSDRTFLNKAWDYLFNGNLTEAELPYFFSALVNSNVINEERDENQNPIFKDKAPANTKTAFGEALLDALKAEGWVSGGFKSYEDWYASTYPDAWKFWTDTDTPDIAKPEKAPEPSAFSKLTDEEKKTSLTTVQKRGAWDNDGAARDSVERLVYAKNNKLIDTNSKSVAKGIGSKGWTTTGLKGFSDGEDFTLTIDGKDYKLEVGYQLYDDIPGAKEAKEALDKIAGGSPTNGQVVMSCGDLYVYSSKKGWCTVSNDFWTSDDTYTNAVEAYKGLGNLSLADEDYTKISKGTSDYGWSASINGDKLSIAINGKRYSNLTIGDVAEINDEISAKYKDAVEGDIVSVADSLFIKREGSWHVIDNSKKAALAYKNADNELPRSEATADDLNGDRYTAIGSDKINGFKVKDFNKSGAGSKLTLYYNGEDHSVSVKGKVTDSAVIEKLGNKASNGDIVAFGGGKMFIYSSYNGWLELDASKDAFNAYKNAATASIDEAQARDNNVADIGDRKDRIERAFKSDNPVKYLDGAASNEFTISTDRYSTGNDLKVTIGGKTYSFSVGSVIDIIKDKGEAPMKNKLIVIAGDLYVSDGQTWYAVNTKQGSPLGWISKGSSSKDYKDAVKAYLDLYDTQHTAYGRTRGIKSDVKSAYSRDR